MYLYIYSSSSFLQSYTFSPLKFISLSDIYRYLSIFIDIYRPFPHPHFPLPPKSSSLSSISSEIPIPYLPPKPLSLISLQNPHSFSPFKKSPPFPPPSPKFPPQPRLPVIFPPQILPFQNFFLPLHSETRVYVSERKRFVALFLD